ncbi:MAG: hypothetical protein ACRC1D_08940 [Culicoidibacterales bacterium]
MIYSLEDLKQEQAPKITIEIDTRKFEKEVKWNTAEDLKNIIGSSLYTAVAFYQTQLQTSKTEAQKLNAFTKLEEAKSALGMGIVEKRNAIVGYLFDEDFLELFVKFPEPTQIAIAIDAMGQLQTPSRA